MLVLEILVFSRSDHEQLETLAMETMTMDAWTSVPHRHPRE
jgi:hypothetical protein